jgi:peptidyl-prolyl cis-trans isomerase SurA
MKKLIFIPIVLSCVTSGYAFTSTAPHQKSTQESPAAIVPLNRIAAIVNNEVITQTDLNKHIHLIKAQLAQQGTPLPAESILDKQVLNQLINQTLQLQLASQNNVVITSQQIDTAIDRIAKNNNVTTDKLYENANKEGLNKKAFREEIKTELMIQQLQQDVLQSRINITQEEIDNYLHNVANDPKMQAQYHLEDILVALPATPTSAEINAAQQRANNLSQQLQHGANFEQLAVAQSSGQKALQGGDLGWRSLGELPEEFITVVSQLQEGQVSQPIRTANGFHILKLVAIQGITPQSNTDEVQLQEIMLTPTAQMPDDKTATLIKKLHQDLIKGADFNTLAQQYSQAPNAAKGGFANWTAISDYPATLQKTIQHLKAGDLSSVIKIDNQYYLIKLLDKRETPKSNAQEREKVANILFQQKSLDALETWISQLRAQTYVQIMAPYN